MSQLPRWAARCNCRAGFFQLNSFPSIIVPGDPPRHMHRAKVYGHTGRRTLRGTQRFPRRLASQILRLAHQMTDLGASVVLVENRSTSAASRLFSVRRGLTLGGGAFILVRSARTAVRGGLVLAGISRSEVHNVSLAAWRPRFSAWRNR